MTLHVVDARLLVYSPHNDGGGAGVPYQQAADAADLVIENDDILSVEIAEKVTDRIDSASLTIDNFAGKYTTEYPNLLNRSDRIALWLETDISEDYNLDDASARPSATQFGESQLGEARYSDYLEPLYTPDLSHRWTGMVMSAPNSHEGGLDYTLSIDAGDWVFQTLKDRRHTYAYENAPIAGSDDAILNRALQAEAPEIDRSRIQNLGTSTDLSWNRRTLLDLLRVSLARSDGIARADDTALEVFPTYTLEPQFTITHDSNDWYAGMTADAPADELANHIILIGGTQPILDDAQETVDTTASLSTGADGRRAIEIQPKGDTIAKVEVWTDPTVAADGTIEGDGIVARIQRDQNGAPVAPGDKERDLASGQVEAEELSTGGWTSIDMSDGSVSRDTAWLILQTKGGSQPIGVRDNGDGTTDAAFRTFYPYDVAVDRSDWESRERYGRIDDALSDDTLETTRATEDAAEARVDSRADIPHVIDGVQAWSERLHSLRPATLVNIDAPRLTPHGGAYVATERATTMQGRELQTEFLLEELATL